MANYIKIATFGPEPVGVCEDMNPQDVVELIKTYWVSKFEQVLPDKPDLMVFPEMCDVPRNYPLDKHLEYYKVRKNQIQNLFAETASVNRCNIVYSSVVDTGDDKFKNSSVFINRNGQIVGTYSKNHLVVEEHTQVGISYGEDAQIIECDFGRVACVICFDLNFNELRLQYVKAKPDLIVFPSLFHGGNVMQSYWAYSCRSHFVGAVTELPSQIRNPFGEVLASSTNYHHYAVATVNLDCCLVHLDGNQEKLKALKSKYKESVEIHDPDYWASVLISSCTDNRSAIELALEFEIELLDDYFERSLKHRQ